MDFLRRTFEQIKSGWNNLSNNQKFLYSGIAVSLIIAITVTGIMLGSKKYVPLYNNLTVSQSGATTQKLKDMSIQYKLSSDGTTILVPDDVVHQLRLDLATDMPAGGVVGFESFNETRFGETETDKRVRFLAALQGELTRTITRMNEVESAMVHLAIPEPSVFISDEKPTTASVFLKLKGTGKMDPEKVRSIIYFVANSVEGLVPDNVTVIDEYGNLLSEGIVGSNSPFSVSTMTATQLDIKAKYEKEVAKSIQNMLERVKGAGKAVVSVSADFDFDNVEINQETYGNSVLRSEQASESRSTGTTPGSSAVGADSNLPGATSYQETGGESSSNQSETIKNYEIDKTTESRIKAPGKITKLSISVIVDGEINDDERISLENVVSSASGLDLERGDLINVVGMPFNTEAFESLQDSIARELRSQQIRTYINYALIALGLLGLIGIGFLLKRRSDQRPDVSLAGKRVGDMATPDYIIDSLDDLDPLTVEKAEIQKKVERLAKTQPEDVARVIKSWLMEDMR